MPLPPEITQRLAMKYPEPIIDPEWLSACYTWVTEHFQLAPAQIEQALIHVDKQLLDSDLTDSMVPGTGIDVGVLGEVKGRLAVDKPVLCQIVAITDIGQSAFSLQNVRQAQIDKTDMSGLATAEAEENVGAGAQVEDEGPIPKYPRSTLRFVLSDGSVTFNAFEYRRIPKLELGATPLGCKVLIRNVLVRRGYAFLEPATVTVIDDSKADGLEERQDKDFFRSLRVRMRLPELPPDDEAPAPTAAPAAVPVIPPDQPPPPPAPTARRAGSEASSDYFGGDDDMVDDTFLQDMERAEQEAIETVASQEFRASQSQSQAQTRVGTAKKPASRAMDLDFLDEDDEDDEDDGWQIKTKGTKSRPAPDVIEISD